MEKLKYVRHHHSYSYPFFKGDVENLASKTPKELTELVEQISGSEDYRLQYEELMY